MACGNYNIIVLSYRMEFFRYSEVPFLNKHAYTHLSAPTAQHSNHNCLPMNCIEKKERKKKPSFSLYLNAAGGGGLFSTVKLVSLSSPLINTHVIGQFRLINNES